MTLEYQNPTTFPPLYTPYTTGPCTGLEVFSTKIGDISFHDRLTNQSRTVSHLDIAHFDIATLRERYFELCARSVLAKRLEVISFFRGICRPVEWMSAPPRIFLYGSRYAQRIVEAVNRLAVATKEEPVTDGDVCRALLGWWDESNAWVMKNIGRRYSEYRLNAEVKGFKRVYSEEEHFVVEHGWTLLSSVDWKMLGEYIWAEDGK